MPSLRLGYGVYTRTYYVQYFCMIITTSMTCCCFACSRDT